MSILMKYGSNIKKKQPKDVSGLQLSTGRSGEGGFAF